VPCGRSDRYATRVSERSELIERAVAAYRTLAGLAETVEDDWQYVTDLTEAYLPAVEALAAGDALRAEAAEAVDEAIAEVTLISDAHRAIDWLSTFPHVVALAVGGDVDAALPAESPAESPAGSEPGSEPEPDDDSPFRILLGGDR
jgi:hypothetical protein